MHSRIRSVSLVIGLTLSLAMVETVAHVDPVGLPLNRFVVAIDVPADMWDRRVELDPEDIDPAWCAIPAGMASAKLGSAWYQAGKSVFLVVPSVVVPEERNVLINAKHPDAQRFLKARVIRRFSYSEVLGRGRNR